MGKTKIQWSDMTWPVVTGCTPCSIGCTNCYAARMAATRLKHHPRYEGLATISGGKARWTSKINFNYDVLEQPLRWKKPRRIFVASMGDLFHPSVPDDFIIEVFVRMGEVHHHIYQLLTKRSGRMFDFISKSTWGVTPLSNVHLGVSVENQAAADERIPLLLQTPAAVRFVSVEPMLEAVNLCAINDETGLDREGYNYLDTLRGFSYDGYEHGNNGFPILDWVICSGESGPGARPMHPDWARSLRDQCQAAGVPFFFKSWGAWGRRKEAGITLNDGPFGFWDNGTPGCNEWIAGGFSSHGEHMVRVGKKAAGHLLDGHTWQQFPVADGAGNR